MPARVTLTEEQMQEFHRLAKIRPSDRIISRKMGVGRKTIARLLSEHRYLTELPVSVKGKEDAIRADFASGMQVNDLEKKYKVTSNVLVRIMDISDRRKYPI